MSDIRYPCYLEKQDEKGQWYWIYHARNAEPIARSSESYIRRSDCTHSIGLVKGSGEPPVFTGD